MRILSCFSQNTNNTLFYTEEKPFSKVNQIFQAPLPQCLGGDLKTHRAENMGSPARKRTTKNSPTPGNTSPG